MKVILAAHDAVSPLVTTWWTPAFVGIFLAIVFYTLWPRNRKSFDDAARMPLRED
ncbi:MAG: cbb3-type cytochrome c oxidase subunit 3 [Afipia sp.]|nr:cbb3-type cytochrome c oxidase subunit 3 [Afipia sp.]